MKWLLALLWLAAIALALWALWQLPLAAISVELQSLTVANYLFWLLLNSAILLVAAWRWQQLASALAARLQVGRLFCLRQAGSTVNFLTPGPHFGGEPLQLYWLYQVCALPLHRAALVLGLDRFFELITNFSVLLAAMAFLALSSTLMLAASLQAVLLLAMAIAVVIGCAALLLAQPSWLIARLEKLTQRWQQHPRLNRLNCEWQQVGIELRAAFGNQRRLLGFAAILSLLLWCLLLAELSLLLYFTGVMPTPLRLLLILVALRLAMLLPTPGGLGTVEAAVLWSFQLLQLTPESAVGFIALIRLRDALVLLLGLGCLAKLQQSSNSVVSSI